MCSLCHLSFLPVSIIIAIKIYRVIFGVPKFKISKSTDISDYPFHRFDMLFLWLRLELNTKTNREWKVWSTSSEIKQASNYVPIETCVKGNTIFSLDSLILVPIEVLICLAFSNPNLMTRFLAYLLCEIKMSLSCCLFCKPQFINVACSVNLERNWALSPCLFQTH